MSVEVQRKLTTILAADAVGYSREMQEDEVRTLGALQASRAVFSKFIHRHHGRIANTAGDGLIAEFPSVVEAVQCAIEVQQELGDTRNDPESTLHFRIGIHLGDVMVDGDDLLGEGVNLAARLESMAEPGGILISQQVYDQVHAKLSVGFDYLGERRPKNFSEDVSVYEISRTKKNALFGIGTRGPYKPSQPQKHISSSPVSEDSKAQIIRFAKLLGVTWVGLLAINFATGLPLWAHYPGIVLGVLLLLKAAPLFVQQWFDARFARALVMAIGLLAINLATWSGYFWSLWPIGTLVFFGIIRNLRSAKR